MANRSAPAAPRSAKAEGLEPRQVALEAARAGLDRKAEEVVILDVRGLASYADFLVLMSGASDRQLLAAAQGVEERLRGCGLRPVGEEGRSGGRWLLIDFGDVVIHLFHRDARAFYDLDGLWADAPREALPAAHP